MRIENSIAFVAYQDNSESYNGKSVLCQPDAIRAPFSIARSFGSCGDSAEQVLRPDRTSTCHSRESGNPVGPRRHAGVRRQAVENGAKLASLGGSWRPGCSRSRIAFASMTRVFRACSVPDSRLHGGLPWTDSGSAGKPEFPANREKYREFLGFSRLLRKSISKTSANSVVCG